MLVGAMLPVLSISMAVVEPGILGSMLLLGFALLVLQYLPLAAAVPIVAAFGVLHGYAHGAEVPADGGFVAYGIGVVASTAMLHAGGIFCGTLLLRHGATLAVRLAGAAAVLGGIAMAAA
jgi:urease accessory protein